MKCLRSLLLGSLLFALTCAVADPDSDRRRLSSQPNAFPLSEADIMAEIQFGRNVAARILARYPLHTNEQTQHYVRLVGHTLLSASARPELTYHFAVLDTDVVNAYAAPGGYIFVTRGALDLMADEAELAAALAHEIAHVELKHIVKAMNISGNDAGMSAIFSSIADPLRTVFDESVDRAMAILFQEGLDQVDELASDQYAVSLLALSGYDTRALEEYFVKIQNQGNKSHAISNTHPSFELRLSALRERMTAMSQNLINRARMAERFRNHVQTN